MPIDKTKNRVMQIIALPCLFLFSDSSILLLRLGPRQSK
ncbi:hypothetical protein DCCM_2851 [Desulfocucumis palustris]|uniref:Uncharacterized protein n=1 Tax=Desulfocucumis palustris TaxID=1898651 RepID=A0A2L2XIL0_9FIRM|nr:hypothetical protein DCCM_2851 [Desulfocucumis palustris]